MDILDKMTGEESKVWETLVKETERATKWIRKVQTEDSEGVLVSVMQMMTTMLLGESEWLQMRAIKGKTRSVDPVEAVMLQEHQKATQVTVRKNKDILWRDDGYVPSALMNVDRAVEVVNTHMRNTIEKASQCTHQVTKKRGRPKGTNNQTPNTTTRARKSKETRSMEQQIQQGGISGDLPVKKQRSTNGGKERHEEQGIPYTIKRNKASNELNELSNRPKERGSDDMRAPEPSGPGEQEKNSAE